ncbi:phage regulatory protein/antirepressor Ant [Kaistia sp. MMO-174]|uniref:phage regulatory protein/antirepressor Ant n=1 Tax=Kaistia sp. MMO-174 TaxID=3081256 RepID=UPI00301785B8
MTTTEMLPHEAERNPIVFAKDGEVFATSRDVAHFFGKEVKHVNEAVRNLIASEPSLARSNFRPFKINDLTGESVAYFEMDRDGFTLLAMGFTGQKALKWKLKYIEAFNLMEAQLRSAAAVANVNLRDPKQLTAVALQLIEVNKELESRVEELKPKAEALDRISTAEGSLCVTDTAKALQRRPSELFAFLRQHHWIYRRPGTSHDLGYQSKVMAGLLEHKVNTVTRPDGSEKIIEQVRVTPKGLAHLAKVMAA